MSRFADKLKSALQVAPPSMGFFSTARISSKPKMLLMAWANMEDFEKTQELREGADAVVVVSAKVPPARTLKATAKALGEIPFGIWFEGDAQNLKTLDGAGVDFVVFSPDKMPLASIEIDKPGRVAGIPFDLEDSLIRTLSELPVDAVIINSPGTAPLTLQDLMRFRRLGDWINKPLLAVVPAPITGDEIKALWDAGIDALVVSLSGENQAAFKELRATLDGLTLKTKRKWMRASAIVPVVKQEEAGQSEEPDEGGDEEDE
jgi:hypothetical protein